jgi:hypothetical protein
MGLVQPTRIQVKAGEGERKIRLDEGSASFPFGLQERMTHTMRLKRTSVNFPKYFIGHCYADRGFF